MLRSSKNLKKKNFDLHIKIKFATQFLKSITIFGI